MDSSVPLVSTTASPRAISIIVPTLNEVENIDTLLENVLTYTHAAGLQVEVIVVDDGSSDGTRDKVRAWEKDHPVTLLARQRKNGLAGAVMAGAEAARGDIVVVMDADLSHPPEKIAELVAPLLAGTHDMTMGSRHVPGGGSPGWPWFRRVISRGAAALAWLYTDVKDPTSGFFAVRRDHMLALGKDAAGFKIALEILARGGEALRVMEVPITFVDRSRGSSKLGVGVMGAYLRQLARLGGGLVGTRPAVQLGRAAAAGAAVDAAVLLLLLGCAPVAFGTALNASAVVGAIVTFAALWRAWRGAEAPVPLLRARTIAAFLIVVAAAAFLRGGLFALLVRSLGLPPALAVFPAAAVEALVTYLGCAFYACAPPAGDTAASRRWAVAAAGLILYLACLKLCFLNLSELLYEEAYYWNYGQHLALSYLDHPPMVAWLIRFGGLLFGHTEVAVRIGAFGSTLIAAAFVYLHARDILGKSAGMRAALLAGALPFFFAAGFFNTPDAPLVACWAGMLFFLGRALLQGRSWAWLGVGACLGLGMLSKYSIALVGLAALVFIVLDRRSRPWLIRPAPYGAVLLAALLFLPVIVWNYQHDWASFKFQGPERMRQSAVFCLPQLIGYVLLLITPVGLAAFCLRLRRGSAATPEGFRLSEARSRLFAIVFTLVPLAVFAFASCRSVTKINWTGPVWLAALPLLALSMTPRKAWGAAALARAWKPTLAALVVLYGMSVHIMAFGLPVFQMPHNRLAVCWRDLASHVEEIEGKVAAETGAWPLVMGMDKYAESSMLAFYDPTGRGPEETASVHLVGRKGLMYAYWFPGELQRGKSLVMVGEDREDLCAPAVERCAKSLEPIQEVPVHRDGRVVATYYARVAHGYLAQTVWHPPRKRAE